MLLLPPAPQSLQWEDLRDKEKDYIQRHAEGRCGFLYVYRDGYVSTIAFKMKKRGKKPGKLLIKECERFELCTNKRYVCDYLMYCRLGGWNVYFDKAQLHSHGGGTLPQSKYLEDGNNWYNEGNEGPWAATVATNDEVERFFKGGYKYFGLRFGWSNAYFKKPEFYKPYAFFRQYMRYLPASEFYCKAGVPNYAMSKALTHLSKEGVKAMRRLLKKADDILIQRASVPEVLKMLGNNATDLTAIHKEEEWKACAKHLKDTDYGIDPKQLAIYLKDKVGASHSDIKSRGFETNKYFEYLSNARTLGYDLHDKGAIFPLDFANASRIAEERVAEIHRNELKKKAKEKEERRRKMPKLIADFAKQLGEERYEGGVLIKPLASTQEFIEMGNYFHNCVGRMGYDEKMAERSSYIVIVYVDDKPTECVEINAKNRTILQELGMHNSISDLFPQLNPLVVRYSQTRSYQN